jgi:large subunit ribosomal protein L16
MKKKSQLRLHKKCVYKHKINPSSTLLLTGDYGFFALENSILTKEQIECCRVIIRRELRKKGFLLIRCNFLIPITSKATGVRMGKGKGAIDKYVEFINIFDCLFELREISFLLAIKLLNKISYKLPFKVCLIDKENNIYTSK